MPRRDANARSWRRDRRSSRRRCACSAKGDTSKPRSRTSRKRADVAVRTFFRYFSSKQDVLFGEVVTDRVTRLRSELAARPASEDPVRSIRVVMDLLDFTGPDEESAIMARMELMRRQPSFVARYLEIMDEMRAVVVEFVAGRTGLDPRRHLYPLLVGGACVVAWDSSLKLWVESGGTASLPALRTKAFLALTKSLPGKDQI